MSRLAVIVGAGPGVGAAVARALGGKGFNIGLISRDEQRLTELGEALQSEGITTGWASVDAGDPEAVTAYRLIGYDNRALDDDDFTRTGVDAGEIGAGHDVTALYEVQLADGVVPEQVIGTVNTRWVSADSGDVAEVEAPITAPDAAAEPSPQLRLAATVADLAQLLKGGGPVADRGVTLESLAARAADLQEQAVPGAEELAEMIELTMSASRR